MKNDFNVHKIQKLFKDESNRNPLHKDIHNLPSFCCIACKWLEHLYKLNEISHAMSTVFQWICLNSSAHIFFQMKRGVHDSVQYSYKIKLSYFSCFWMEEIEKSENQKVQYS